MRLRLPLVLVTSALALSGCVVQNPNGIPVAPPPVVTTPITPVPSVPHSDVRIAINREMSRRLPGANVAPYTDCIVQNATAAELADIGNVSASGGNISDSVASVVGRPSTSQCIANVAKAAKARSV
ncbi:hypothetical protein [Paracoccus aminophilus]|uniref:Succinate dehydrogenase n=1 Tax=Paracoccus aminophilus JCM 7686 TaxID=1367847 RepID=S5XQI2_PARAH|nr:hypothetical protein [Paracoccus aminophilus]AGT09634.1 hypothetical protein JCM7686_2566 [Paracoccus aminophilus JCM 7686]